MATTKIWNIKGRVGALIDYAINPDKTDLNKSKEFQSLHDVIDYAADDYKTERSLFVSGVNTTPDTAKAKMMQTKLQFNKMTGNAALHALQSFKPGEVTPELAHTIGIKLAEELWGDRFEIVVATHLNKSHIHNHFVVNSVSFVDGRKFYDSEAEYRRIRAASDRLCEEYNLSVIKNPKERGKHYAEWRAEKNGFPTLRGQIKEELDEIIKCSYTYKDFIGTLKKRGYELKSGTNIKYPSVKPAYSERFVRLKSLGKDYTIEAIQNRIVMARNGIKQLDTPIKDYNAWSKKYEPKKLTGFKALYFHYLYLFGKVRKKETPQRVSFFMREELLKLDRYQKQFKFLYDNDIETLGQVKTIKLSAEDEIEMLTAKRQGLYKHKSEVGASEQISIINDRLKDLRVKVKICKNIISDSEVINAKYNGAMQLEQESKMQNRHLYEHHR